MYSYTSIINKYSYIRELLSIHHYTSNRNHVKAIAI